MLPRRGAGLTRNNVHARAHSEAEVAHLEKFGADHIVVGEREIAREMARHIFGEQAALPVMNLAGEEDAFRRALSEAGNETQAEERQADTGDGAEPR